MFSDIAKFHELKQSLQKTQQLDDTTSTTTAPIATVPVYYSTPVYYYDTSVAPPASLLQPELVIPTSLCQRPAVRIVCCRLGCARFLTVSGDLLFVTGDRARLLRCH